MISTHVTTWPHYEAPQHTILSLQTLPVPGLQCPQATWDSRLSVCISGICVLGPASGADLRLVFTRHSQPLPSLQFCFRETPLTFVTNCWSYFARIFVVVRNASDAGTPMRQQSSIYEGSLEPEPSQSAKHEKDSVFCFFFIWSDSVW